jgi:hypothetical protein
LRPPSASDSGDGSGLDECGFTVSETIAADLGLAYPSTVSGAVTAAAGLWQADLANVQALLTAPVNVAAWNEASLSWLVSATSDERRIQEGGRRVGPVDVEGVRSTTEMFDLGAWMSYDAGLHGLAQRYFVQALKLAEAAGDRLLAAGVLDAMSHQANFLGNHREAANPARTARMGTAGVGSACSAAHVYAMEARALAMAGDASGCDKAMVGAVQEFERRKPDDDPADWFAYFDDAELAAELGHCNRDLGRAVDASVYASQSIGANGEYVRSDFFVTMVLADAYLGQGEVEQACDAALMALKIGEQLKSARRNRSSPRCWARTPLVLPDVSG